MIALLLAFVVLSVAQSRPKPCSSTAPLSAQKILRLTKRGQESAFIGPATLIQETKECAKIGSVVSCKAWKLATNAVTTKFAAQDWFLRVFLSKPTATGESEPQFQIVAPGTNTQNVCSQCYGSTMTFKNLKTGLYNGSGRIYTGGKEVDVSGAITENCAYFLSPLYDLIPNPAGGYIQTRFSIRFSF